jgi:hypothetical protein
MNPDYIFLCGVMWAQYASEDAGRELVRALRCGDPDVALLASAILERRLGPSACTELASRTQPFLPQRPNKPRV